MKFSTATVAALASAITATAASLPERFSLVADDNSAVLTDGQYLYIGNATSADHVPVVLTANSAGALTYLADGAVPTAFQNLYIVENSVAPAQFTVPHSGNMPEGANMTGFGVNEDGQLTHGGNAWFAIDGYGEAEEKTVFWYGAHNSEYMSAYLTVKEA
ncbi:uncharacterized protein BP01DRAFT_421997 [Aspergillus saccharolyticus JOP 1030-1]|uniref:Uncharacterized protein n=1 Tax=Aspergillus saccharolyticus JOP 1030-1 TaxID=1450539 RepID=A0A319A4S0_9EURO|nr:hypothetical protein BP01DRAFT_421997 [Aspergillus saccharolyticus JOP 1030-1]PYH47138.1 hypothetical protein BP01DRAFT_421997 [Aspergillus saccharolyticus JOP 1030-1]